MELPEDGKAIAKRFEEEGVNAIHVSAGLYETKLDNPTVCCARGCLVDLAAEESCESVPVIAVGRINDPELAECILAEGKADLVAFGRGLLADEELPNKVTEGRAGEVRKCIACLQACVDELLANQQVGCTVNARTGRECEFPMTKAETPRKVLVVGGGPAGMEAARVATIRGHKVTLWEKASELGGQLPLVVAPPEKDEFGTFADFLVKELERFGVEVHLNRGYWMLSVEKTLMSL